MVCSKIDAREVGPSRYVRRMRALRFGLALVAIVAVGCGPRPNPSSTSERGAEKKAEPLRALSTPVREGERLGPFLVDRVDASEVSRLTRNALPAVGQKIRIPFAAAGVKLTVIDFWVTWCPSSRVWFTALEALHRRYGAEGLAIIGVSQDDDRGEGSAPIREYAKAQGVTFPIAWDREHALSDAVHPPHWQSLVVVDRDGVVKLAHAGTGGGREERVAAAVTKLLADAR